MLKFTSALLYTALAIMANGASADTAALEALRDGDMRKLVIHDEPVAGSAVPFLAEDGSEMTLAAYADEIVVLNFWATWCAPCRHEMPMLSDLQRQFEGKGLSVVTIATGRNPRPAMERFFAEIGVDNLPLHTDARQELARAFGVLGLPVTIILDREGREIARLLGDAEWNSDSAVAILSALVDG